MCPPGSRDQTYSICNILKTDRKFKSAAKHDDVGVKTVFIWKLFEM